MTQLRLKSLPSRRRPNRPCAVSTDELSLLPGDGQIRFQPLHEDYRLAREAQKQVELDLYRQRVEKDNIEPPGGAQRPYGADWSQDSLDDLIEIMRVDAVDL